MNRLDSDPDRAWTALDEVLSFHDEPVHAMSAIIGFDLMKLAAARGVKVILNGNGADEVIGGYSSYFRDYWYTLLKAGDYRGAWDEIGRFVSVHGGNQVKLFLAVTRHLLNVTLGQAMICRPVASLRNQRSVRRHPWFTGDVFEEPDVNGRNDDWTLDSMLRQSVERQPLPLYLRLEDRNSMAHSVESRLPFLDYRLVSLVFSSAVNWKIRGPWNKYLLRESMRERIPESVRTRVEKWGFPVPQAKWMSTAWYGVLDELLASQEMRERGIYNLSAIRSDLELHRQGKRDFSPGLFSVIQFELWSRRQETVMRSAA
jgi:asparagine synthase (glutamine-hydrolysing)